MKDSYTLLEKAEKALLPIFSGIDTQVKSNLKKVLAAYRDRKVRKRNFRSLWIQRINAGAREHGLTYGRMMDGLNKAGIEIDRKVLSDLAIHEPETFANLVGKAKDALAYLKDATPGEFEAAVG